jgi:hypothetical protein
MEYFARAQVERMVAARLLSLMQGAQDRLSGIVKVCIDIYVLLSIVVYTFLRIVFDLKECELLYRMLFSKISYRLCLCDHFKIWPCNNYSSSLVISSILSMKTRADIFCPQSFNIVPREKIVDFWEGAM